MILVLLTGEFAHCVHPRPSLGVLQLEQRVGRLLTEESKVKARWAGYIERLHQADLPAVELDAGVLISTLLTLQSTVIRLRLWKHRVQ